MLERQRGSLFTRRAASRAKLSRLCAVANRKRTAGRQGICQESLRKEATVQAFFSSFFTHRIQSFSVKMLSIHNKVEPGWNKKVFILKILPASTGRSNRSWAAVQGIIQARVHINISSSFSYWNVSLCFFFPVQIYEKHNHNMRALLFYYQWVLLLGNHFKWYVTWEQISFTNH